jgi:glycosyltransferase involved in cell wall biosynthesis
LIAEALAAVGRRSRFRFHAIGADPLEIPGISSTAQPWRADTEIEDLSQFDIGVVPLPDNPWNRRKFNLKIAQYMSLGIVPVATPLGSNPEVITAGVDGFLAGDREEWVSSLERLIQDSALRTSMAEHAARKASERFTIQAQQGRVVEAFSSAVT